MKYMYAGNKYFFGFFVLLVSLSALANQYTIVNKSGSEVTLYFGPEKNMANYPVVCSVSGKETKTVKTSFTAQTIKCTTDRSSLIGRAVTFVDPNISCENILVQVEDSNTELFVSAHCNEMHGK